MRRWIDALASNNAISFWSWFVAMTIALVNAPQLSAQYEISMGRWVIAVLIVHALLSPLLIFGWALLPRVVEARIRVAFVLAIFIAFGLLRALCMSVFVRSQTDRTLLSIFLPWLISSSLVATVSMAGVALVIHGFRSHGSTMVRLSNLQRSLSFARAANEQSEQSIKKSLIDDVRAKIQEELHKLNLAAPVTSLRSSDQLRLLAEAVVRPVSHRLLFARDEQDLQAPVAAQVNSKVIGVREIVAKIRPVNYLTAPLFVESLVTPFLIFRYGLGITLWNLILALPSLVLLSYLVERKWRFSTSSFWNVCLLGASYWLVGVITAVPVFVVVNAIGYSMPFYLSNGVFYLFATTLFMIDAALDRRRREVQDQLAEVLQAEAVEVSRYRNRLQAAQQRVGKLLHSHVQGELVALAMENELKGSAGESKTAAEFQALISKLVERIDDSRESSSESQQVVVDSQSEISELIKLWSGALDIRLDIEHEVFAKLDKQEYLRNAITDVIAEGLTNAVKHRNEPDVLVQIRSHDDSCEITIRSRGTLLPEASQGAGTKIIQRAAESVQVQERDGFIEMIARIA